jgi:hypothetical protein
MEHGTPRFERPIKLHRQGQQLDRNRLQVDSGTGAVKNLA